MAATTTSIKMGDDFFRVPKLANDGKNWVVYRDRLELSVMARGLEGHLDGQEVAPIKPQPTTAPDGTEIPVPTTVMEVYTKTLRNWMLQEAIAKQQIASTIPDLLYLNIKSKTTTKEMWDALKNEFETRSKMFTIDLHKKLQEIRCTEGGDVRAHFESMTVLREDLAALGDKIDNSDYAAIILGSLPKTYGTFLAAVSGAMKIANQTLDPDALMQIVCDEYDRRRITEGTEDGGKGTDEAMMANGKPKKKLSIKCFNCGKKGHKRADCWAKGGGKEGQGPKSKNKNKDKGKDSGNAAEDDEKLDAWLAELDLDDLPLETDDTGIITSDNAQEIEADAALVEEQVETAGAATHKDEWDLYDSGASRHMSACREDFRNYEIMEPRGIRAADKRTFQAIGRGDLKATIPNGSKTTEILLKNVLYCPGIGQTLVSISGLAKEGYSILFEGTSCRIYNKKRILIGRIEVLNGIYKTKHIPLAMIAGAAEETLTIDELHRRLAHVAPAAIKKAVEKGWITGVKLDDTKEARPCESCEYAKMTRKAIKLTRERPRSTKFGQEVHSDVWGPALTETKGRRKYYVSFRDDFTRWVEIRLLRQKSEVPEAYLQFVAWAKTQHGVKNIKTLVSDRGGEYMSDKMKKHLADGGTTHKPTVHDTPEYNGIAERLNRTLVERTRAILHASGLPKNLWGEAIRHVVWLKNRTPTRSLPEGKNPLRNVTWQEGIPGRPTLMGNKSLGTRLDRRQAWSPWT